MTCPGRHTVKDLPQIMAAAVQRLHDEGLTHVTGLNFYMTLVDQYGRPMTHFANGDDIPGKVITLDPPYRSAADEHGV